MVVKRLPPLEVVHGHLLLSFFPFDFAFVLILSWFSSKEERELAFGKISWSWPFDNQEVCLSITIIRAFLLNLNSLLVCAGYAFFSLDLDLRY